jgi:hypothetical protein
MTFAAVVKDAIQQATQQQQGSQPQSAGGTKISGSAKISGAAKISGLAQSSSGAYWLDRWRDATVSFGEVVADRSGRQYYHVIGTGFVATDGKKVYFVTAKHIFFEPSHNWHPAKLNVRFAWEEEQSVYTDFGWSLPLIRENTDLWKAPPDGSDIVAIGIPSSFAGAVNGHYDKFVAVSPNDMASSDDIYEGNSVIVLGYPGIIGNEYLVRAVSRSGIIAWVSPNDSTQQEFLVDANLAEGNSGGPVIASPAGPDRDGGLSSGKRPILLGLVSKGPKQDIQIMAAGQPVIMSGPNLPQASPLQATVVGIGSFGFIEPATKIKNFVQSLANAGSEPH